MTPRPLAGITPLLAPLLLGGCVAKTAFDVATAPVRVAGKAIDLATTSQSEADEARGREIRRREERLGELERDHEKQSKRCAKGQSDACRKAEQIREEMDDILPTVPLERRR